MLFVFNKDKIISCAVAMSIVIVLFIFSVSLIQNSDTKLIQVSSNIANGIENNNIDNNSIINNIIVNNLKNDISNH